MNSRLDQGLKGEAVSQADASIVTSNYQATVSRLADGLFYSEKVHQYTKNIYHEAYASDWFIGFASLPKNRVQLRSANSLIDLCGPTALFLPPFSLVELHIEEGPLKWSCIGSTIKIPFDIRTPRYLTGVELCPPHYKADVYKILAQLNKAPEFEQQKYPSAIAAKAKAYMDAHFCEELKISSVAQYLNCSRVVLTRAFKSVYGISLIEYRHKLRIYEALIRMRYGLSVTEAICAVGFSDPSQFNLQFKKNLNALPSQYKIQKLFGTSKP